MVKKSAGVVFALGLVVAGCAVPVEETGGLHPDDVKPEDGSEFVAADFGTTQQPHALHYTDGTNLWMETGYPMGTDNPNCKDWYVYDRWLSKRPKIGTTKFTTYETNHAWAQDATVKAFQAAIPNSLGYSDAWKAILLDHNSVVARSSGRCSGRYVFQWDNRDSGYVFASTSYWAAANIPSYLIPQNKAACTATAGESVPATLVDLYVCEVPTGTTVTSLSSSCGRTSGNWRKVGSSAVNGYWSGSSCSSATGVYYQAPSNKLALSFNMVIKAGIGHGVAPAEIYIVRYN